MPPFEAWAWAFAWTVLLEVPLVVAFTWSLWGPRSVLVGLGLQLLTHPALWYLFPRFSPYWLWLIVAEVTVAAAEAGVLAAGLRITGWSWPAALKGGLGISVLANLFSTLFGLIFI